MYIWHDVVLNLLWDGSVSQEERNVELCQALVRAASLICDCSYGEKNHQDGDCLRCFRHLERSFGFKERLEVNARVDCDLKIYKMWPFGLTSGVHKAERTGHGRSMLSICQQKRCYYAR
jgi:hypothetical protein